MAQSKLAVMFRKLRKQGFIAKRRFLCCQSCAWYELGDLAEGTNVVFMHQQDESSYRESGKAYLAWSGDGEAIAQAARNSGLEVEWDGTEARRIKVWEAAN